MSAMDSTRITLENGQLHIPNHPIIHYIEGDGIGIDITPVMIDVVNAAVQKAYNGEKLSCITDPEEKRKLIGRKY